jgi:hypothetical protein
MAQAMYDIPMSDVSDEFAKCCQAAAVHLEHQAQGPLDSWLRADLSPPSLEDLSFRLGNQLFFIRVEDLEGHLDVPGNLNGLLSVADGYKGHPCLMPMRNRFGQWSPARACRRWLTAPAKGPASLRRLDPDRRSLSGEGRAGQTALPLRRGMRMKDSRLAGLAPSRSLLR